MLAKGQITVTNLDDGKTPFLHQAYKMKDGRFLKHYPVYEAPPVNGYKEGDLWHWNGEDYPGRNLLLPDTVIVGRYLLETNGSLGNAGTHSTSDFIPAQSATQYSMSTKNKLHQVRVVYYNSSKTYISGILMQGDQGTSKVVMTPVGTAYIRVSSDFVNGDSLSMWIIEKILTGGKQSGYFVANKSNTTFDFNDWTFYADELAYSDTDKFYPKFEGTYSDYNEVASDNQTKYTWKIIKADDGIGIKSVKEYYAVSTSNVTPPSSPSDWSETPKATNTTNKYLWNYEVYTYSNGDARETTKRVIGTHGTTGATGNGITSVTNRYLATTLAAGVTTATSGWTIAVQATDSVKKYLWNYEEILYTNGSKIPTTPVIIGTHGEKGENAVVGLLTNESITLPANKDGLVSNFTGATGVFDVYDGITKKNGSGVKYSLVTQSNITVNINATTGAYSVTAMPTATPTGTTILNGYATLKATYNGVAIEKQLNVAKSVTGATGATGASGKDGIAGKDGKGIKSTVISYATSTSGTTQPTTGWDSTVPSLTKGQYLWTRTIWTYTDNTTETGYSVSYIAKDGNNGTNGIAGKDGVGITSTVISYAGSTSGTVTPTSDWDSKVPTVAPGSFLWTRTIWTYTDNTTETGYSVARMGSNGATGSTGATGATGASATSYWITASNNIIGKSQTGVINPTTITFKGFSKTGTANPVAYSGRFIIQTSTNGTTYDNKYVSSANQSSYTYTIPADSLFVKCLFYMAGGTTVLLDEQTVPIVESAEGIQVGNANLLLNSRLMLLNGSDKGIQNILTEALKDSDGTEFARTTQNDVGGGNAYNNGGFKFSQTLRKGATYTISLDIRSTFATGLYFYLDPSLTFNGIPSTNNEWKRIFFTHTVTTKDITSGILGGFNNIPQGKYIDYKNWQITEGNVSLPWQPAPEDARTYKAWANSADGTVDFTRVYPNENLLLESNQSVTNSNYNIRSYLLADDTLTATDDVVITLKGSLGADRNSFRAYNSGGTYAICTFTSLGDGIYQYKGKWNPNGGNSSLVIYQFNSTNTSSSTIEWIKLERGTTPTIYTTNPQDSLSGSIPKYVGFSPIDSDDPKDYTWILNPDYAENSSKEYAESKIEQTSTDIMMSVTESFVGSEEFGTYIDSVGTQFQQTAKDFNFIFNDVKESINGVAENVEKNYSEIQKYIRFEDGNIILGSSDSDSTLKITQNEIAFMQGGSKVAYFSGQSFYINKGILVESMQVGEHRMTRGSGGHTSFDWIG